MSAPPDTAAGSEPSPPHEKPPQHVSTDQPSDEQTEVTYGATISHKDERGREERLVALAVGIRVALGTSAEAAIQVGQMLNEAKAMLGHREWLPWLRLNVEISGRTATDDMRLARSTNRQHAADLSIRAPCRRCGWRNRPRHTASSRRSASK